MYCLWRNICHSKSYWTRTNWSCNSVSFYSSHCNVSRSVDIPCGDITLMYFTQSVSNKQICNKWHRLLFH